MDILFNIVENFVCYRGFWIALNFIRMLVYVHYTGSKSKHDLLIASQTRGQTIFQLDLGMGHT